jgi:hypothetical protein
LTALAAALMFGVSAQGAAQTGTATGAAFTVNTTDTVDDPADTVVAWAAQSVAANPDFQLIVSPQSQTLRPGTSVSFAIEVGSIGGFNDPVDLSVSGLPGGVTSSFSVDPITPDGTSFLILTAAAAAATGSFQLTVTGTGRGITHEATGSVTVDFGLVPVCMGTVRGVVTNSETGSPVSGAEIDVDSGQVATTGADGSYSYDQVRLGENNSPVDARVSASLDPPLFEHIGTFWKAEKQAVVVCNKDNPVGTVVNLALVPVHPGELSGKIVVGNPDPNDFSHVIPTTAPIEGASVSFAIGHYALDTSGADGAYDLLFHLDDQNAPLVDPQLTVDRPGLPFRHGYWQRFVPAPTIGPDQHLTEDVALVKQCTISITGHVVDGSTGLRMANVTVDVGNLASTDGARTQTDATGAFSFPELLIGVNNQPTSFGVGPNLAGYSGGDVFTPTLGCGDTADLTLTPQPVTTPFGAVVGHVYDKDTGLRIAGATVVLPNCDGVTCDTKTGADGSYTLDHVIIFGGSPTSFAMVAAADGYYDELAFPVLHVGPPPTTQDFHLLLKRFGRLAGVVRDQITHAPIANAISNCGATSNPDGSYQSGPLTLTFPNAPTDVSCHWFANGYWAKDVTTTVHADQTTQQDIDLLPLCQGATITGTVVNASTGNPIADAIVQSGTAFATTDAQGHYELDNVTVGTNNTPHDVDITASAGGFFSSTKRVTVFCGASIILDFGRTTQPGRIVVVEKTNPSGSTQRFDFTRNWADSFTLTDGQSNRSDPLTPGSGYSVAQAKTLPDGWTLTSATCDDGSTATNIVLDPGETVTCTFTNKQAAAAAGTIVVKKVTEPSGSTQSFAFTASYASGGFSLKDGQSNTSGALAAGTYSVSETAVPGWHSSASCSDGSPVSQISLTAGETVTCTFTNAVSFSPGGGAFVIGDKNAAIGTAVTFWGAQWWKLNSLSGGAAPAAFKGFAKNVTVPGCGGAWSTDPGNSAPPPPGPLPAYLAVIVTSSTGKNGPTITGNTLHIVIVKTNPGYAPNPGHAGTGTVVSVVC